MGTALRRVNNELGVPDEVAGVSILDTAADLLDLVHAYHPALPPLCYPSNSINRIGQKRSLALSSFRPSTCVSIV